MPWNVKKIQRFSKIIEAVLSIALVFYIGLFVYFIFDWERHLAQITADYIGTININLIRLGAFNVTLPGIRISEGTLIVGIYGVLYFAVTIAVLVFAIRVFRSLRRYGTPFHHKIIQALKWLAAAMLVQGFLSSVTGFFAAIVVWLLRYVFEYGYRLQAESDTTL
jgi:hypothetical protein